MKDKIAENIRKYHLIEEGEHVVLGLSGGPDSVCLFHILKELGYAIHPVHVNHGMRETAGRDAAFVQALCERAGVRCDVFEVDCPALAKELRITTEEAGRKARYDAFRQVADRLTAQGDRVKIAVAHNADDQAETLLFRLLRGTGTDGLAGMERARRDGAYTIIRPLLDVTREEIEACCSRAHLAYVIDETNEQPLYTRNRIRLELLPLIRERYNENITAGLCRLAEVAGEDRDYLWHMTEEAYEACVIREESVSGEEVALDRDKAAQLHPAIRHRVMLRALRELGLWEDVSFERLRAIEAQTFADASTKVIQLPHGYQVTFAFDRIIVRSEEGAAGRQFDAGEIEARTTDAEGEVRSMKERLRAEGYPHDEIWLDADLVAAASGIPADRLADAVTVRTRMEGDMICTGGGTRKLKKLLGEMKIPADERDVVSLIAVGRCILAVCPDSGRNRYAEALRITEGTETVLTVKFV